MERLDLSDNAIGDAGAIALSQCISKIDDLVISHCKVTTQGMKALAQEIKKRNNAVGLCYNVQGRIYHHCGLVQKPRTFKFFSTDHAGVKLTFGSKAGA